MAKKQLPKKTEQAVAACPRFNPSQVLCAGIPAVITDMGGNPWVVDPNKGGARPLRTIHTTARGRRVRMTPK